MKCPKCDGHKQRVIETRRTQNDVWRRRVCGFCHHAFVTQEVLANVKTMPTEVHRFKDANRTTPKVGVVNTDAPKKFDTGALTNFKW